MDYMRTTESTEEVSSHPVKNTRWGVKTWLEHARATEKPNLLPQNDLWPYLFGIKSRRNPPQLMNDKSNGKSRLICKRRPKSAAGAGRKVLHLMGSEALSLA